MRWESTGAKRLRARGSRKPHLLEREFNGKPDMMGILTSEFGMERLYGVTQGRCDGKQQGCSANRKRPYCLLMLLATSAWDRVTGNPEAIPKVRLWKSGCDTHSALPKRMAQDLTG